MPDPIKPVSPSSFNFEDAPDGGFSLDQIFSDQTPEENKTTTPVTEPGTPDPQAQTPPSQPFLKTATGTVYNSVEDAIAGTEHKDALIAQLREQLTKQNGNDPLKQTPQQTQQPVPESYTQNPKQYFKDLDEAVKSGDERKIMDVQQRFIQEQLSPYAPMLTNVAREQARNQVTNEVPDFRKFQESDEYNKVLESFPLLKTSIQQAESNPQLAPELTQLYRMSHDIYAGRNIPKIVQDAQPQTTVVQPVRPTVNSAPLAPPSPTAPPKSPQDARKDAIARMEAAGIGDRRF